MKILNTIMKIQDIIEGLQWNPSSLTFNQTIDKMLKTMRSVGWGGYSETFQHPNRQDVVIKLFAEDMGYAKYFLWITKNQNNRYVPRIIENEDGNIIKLFRYRYDNTLGKKRSQKFGMVYLRKLNDMTDQQFDEFSNYLSSFLEKNSNKLTSKLRAYAGNDFLSGFGLDDWLTISEKSKDLDPDLSVIAGYFSDLYRKHGPLDIHSGNIMWDPIRNNPVFIDVLSLER